MRSTAATRLTSSLLCALGLHGVVLAAAAVVLSRQSSERPVPVRLDVDVVEVPAPKPPPIVDAAPAGAPPPAKVSTSGPARRRPHQATAPSARQIASAADPAMPDPAAAVASDLAGPSGPAAPSSPTSPTSLVSRGPAVTAASSGDVVSAEPHYRSNPRPEYPLPSLRRHEEGTVLLTVVIEADGAVAAVSLKRSSGHPLLDRAALEVVRHRWAFDPARIGGRPVSSTRDVPLRFSLSDVP